ncbi:MAG: hypothetical protein K2Q26_14855, partial [Bdellovibrionales bacterium]|nr:hypothetical protein [Bdellovibrionales bacterium]
MFNNGVLLQKKFLIYNLVLRNIKLKYRSSFLGFFWTLLVPISNALIYIYVFKFVMKVNIPTYSTFIVSGILHWGLYLSTVSLGMESIVGNSPLIGKVPIPPRVFVFCEAFTGLINFVFALPVLFAIMVW